MAGVLSVVLGVGVGLADNISLLLGAISLLWLLRVGRRRFSENNSL